MAGGQKSFGDVEFFQTKQKFEVRFNTVISKLQTTLKQKPNMVKMVQDFRACIKPDHTLGVSRLPLYAKKLGCEHRNKGMTALTLLSYAIQEYWRFHEFGHSVDRTLVDVYLEALENIVNKGLDKFKLTGDKYPDGYRLEEI